MSEPLFITPEGTDRLINLALDGLASPHTRRAYQAALDEFLTWSQGQQPSELCKALVNRSKAILFEKELAPATINLRLAAVRRLAQEAADNGLVDGSVASAISKVHGHCCPVRSQIESVGYRHRAGCSRSRMLEGPVEWAFFQKA